MLILLSAAPTVGIVYALMAALGRRVRQAAIALMRALPYAREERPLTAAVVVVTLMYPHGLIQHSAWLPLAAALL